MVTKGYRKGVYERVTKGTVAAQRSAGILPAGPGASRPRRWHYSWRGHSSNMNVLFGSEGACVYFFQNEILGHS